MMLWLTWLRHDQTMGILRALGSDGPILIGIFFVFATTLALLKFELTDLVYVALVITAYMAMFPLLGMVLSSWLAVGRLHRHARAGPAADRPGAHRAAGSGHRLRQGVRPVRHLRHPGRGRPRASSSSSAARLR